MAIKLTKLSLREMQAMDCSPLQQLHREIDSSPWSAEQFSQCLEPPHRSFVAVLEEELVGFLVFVVIERQAEILNFGIHQAKQGQGFGRAFLREVLADLPEKTEDIFLDVRVSNLRASNLYHSLGFKTVAVRREYYRMAGGGREDGLVMKLAM